VTYTGTFRLGRKCQVECDLGLLREQIGSYGGLAVVVVGTAQADRKDPRPCFAKRQVVRLNDILPPARKSSDVGLRLGRGAEHRPFAALTAACLNDVYQADVTNVGACGVDALMSLVGLWTVGVWQTAWRTWEGSVDLCVRGL
jgi:hypothetical protein